MYCFHICMVSRGILPHTLPSCCNFAGSLNSPHQRHTFKAQYTVIGHIGLRQLAEQRAAQGVL